MSTQNNNNTPILSKPFYDHLILHMYGEIGKFNYVKTVIISPRKRGQIKTGEIGEFNYVHANIGERERNCST